MELPIPHYFTSENSKALKERDKLLGAILAKMAPTDAAEVTYMYMYTHTNTTIQ